MDTTRILSFLKDVFAFNENSPLLFTQFYFWAFFAVVFCLFALMRNRTLLRNSYLFAVSLFFYYKTSGLFVLILLFVTLSDFFYAKRIHRSRRRGWKKFWLVCSIVTDLFLLCYFKYAYFITDVLNNMFGLQLQIFDVFAYVGNLLTGGDVFRVDQIVLPVGISFFTFQCISYTVDVYKERVEPVRNILDFGFYVSFFPQCVAGPIVRAKDFIPQLYKPYFLSRRQFGIAVFWILNGLAKKIILSDYLAVNFVDRVFDNPLLFSGFENLSALFVYSLQVYADFSGYTDIAIGVAMIMGFYLPRNFNSPYKAPSAQNFWKRWHISLSSWLQNYVYIPLGGNRNATFGTYFWIILIALVALILTGSIAALAVILTVAFGCILVAALLPDHRKKMIANINSFITMLIGGLWHGASWNFMIWGGLNGIGMIIFKIWKDMNWHLRMLLLTIVLGALAALCRFMPLPVWNLFFVWVAVIYAGSLIRYIYHLCRGRWEFAVLGNAWAVLQTFVFITFTRLFFRSGSNLDPATANEVAWNTAGNMVRQIGGHWDLSIIPDIISAYSSVFILFTLGMLIHWLPERWKRWYRLNFALLPLPLMVVAVVALVFVVYQFITADLQPFIYFQF
ncbi:MAG: MBOAT family protein [Bacteroidales bacterium]|nr:MBOAT family protein [Bacteroidales bacterium]